MTDNTTVLHEDKNDDSGYTVSQLSPRLPDFEFQECKTEPCVSRTNSTEDLSTLDEPSSPLHIPLPVFTIRTPTIMLERCDKIWETLQLIKIQTDATDESDVSEEEEKEKEEGEEEGEEEAQAEAQTEAQAEEEEEEEEEEKEEEEQIQQPNIIESSASSTSYIKNEPTFKHNNAMSLPFKFSVQKTRKLYPCSTCGKQYMLKRSLRKHAERMHGIVLPVRRRGPYRKFTDSNVAKVANSAVVPNKKDDSDKLTDKEPLEKVIAKQNLPAKQEAKPDNVEFVKEYAVSKYVKCMLCKRTVKSLKEHVIHYHKITGHSSNIMKFESSLLNEPSSSKASLGNRKTTLKDILSGKPSQKVVTETTRDESHIMDDEKDADQEFQETKKRKVTLPSSKEDKRIKLDKKYENYAPVRNTTSITPRKRSINLMSYKCDICLGTYASSHGLYKHRRVHYLRGETKENFHKFQCRYLNSPLNKNRLKAKKNASTSNHVKGTNMLRNWYKPRQNKNTTSTIDGAAAHKKETDDELKHSCLCGKAFRLPHSIAIHKKSCKLYQQEINRMDTETPSSDRDSGIGINITLKKRDDGYAIVGKDSDEERSQKSVHFQDDASPSNRLEHPTNNATSAVAKQQEGNKSKYSKDHSILKLRIADEDEIIDIEDDLQLDSIKISDRAKLLSQKGKVIKSSLVQQNSNVKNVESGGVPDKVSTLKQICQKIIDRLQVPPTNEVKDKETCREDKRMKNREIDQENIQLIDQEVNYKKRQLRSSNKRQRNVNGEFDYSYGDDCKTKTLDLLLACGYCNEQFSNSNSYNNHQCTVKEGRSFDEFSLHLICFYCNETLSNYAEFDRHVRFEHLDLAFHCYQCTERFTNDKARLRHFRTEHNDTRCRFCSKKVSVSLKALHEGYHLGFGYPCHQCKKAYSNKKNLSYHKYTIHPQGADNLLTCTICLKPIKLKSFRGHMSTHKHNACHFCGKVFSDRTGLEYHTMIHHGTNSKLKCNVCGARFLTKKQLDRHEKTEKCNSDMRKKNTAIHVKSH